MWNCACCGRTLSERAIENIAIDEGGERVKVGSDCIKNIKDAGTDGYYHADSGNGPFYSIAAWEELEAA